MTVEDAIEIRRMLLSLTPNQRRALANAASLTEAAASAALAKEKTNG